MNTSITTLTAQRLTAVAISFLLTAGMLFGVNGLATGEASVAQLARAAAASQA
jgi:hypothetical protein